MRFERLVIWLFAVLPISAIADTKVGQHCSGATWPTCYLYVDGPIVNGTFKKFQEFLTSDEVDGHSGQIFLNSRGGSLGEALQIGRLVRDYGLNTKVGKVRDFSAPTFAVEGVCESACAYIFMAGVKRSLRDGDVLGVHRFFSTERSIEGGTAQQMSGQLISYMVEMGVDARLFTLASRQAAEGMHYVTSVEAKEFDLVTDEAYGQLNLEPYKEGIIAWTRPDGPSAPGNVDQVTFLCRGGHPEILFFLRNQAGIYERKSVANGGHFQGSLGKLDASFVSGRDAGTDAYYTIYIGREYGERLFSRSEVNLTIWYPSVIGGSIGANLVFSETDHKKLRYTFAHCIE
ncbi:MAG: hypothetical protein AAGA74_02340 [Pseudomonadota bacterium]